jgi:hypothetical protein
MMICDMLQDDLESSTFRNRAYFFYVLFTFTHPENDLDGELYVHVRYDMDLMINSHAYEILLIWFVVIFLFIQYHFHNSQSIYIAFQKNLRNLPIYLKVKWYS